MEGTHKARQPVLYGERMSGISRRQALAGLGSISVGALIAACSDDDDSSALDPETNTDTTAEVEPKTSSGDLASRFDDAAACRKTAEETEGPFYFDVDKIRSDISEDREGVTLRLGVRVRDAAECKPIANAVVDVWHCDAEGSYSEPGESYCRGAQVTNRKGIVEFTTVYPGWYPGRTVHIHGKVHLDKQTVLTTQFYFDDKVSASVFVDDPYLGESNRDGFNDSDGLYQRDLELTLSKESGGYLGLITLDVASA
jgi:protocatechuate 3,4-dioxygenase beta subunit